MHLVGLLRMASTLAVLTIPFPILGTLIDSEASRGLYLLFIAGVVLVNYLAHSLSRTVEHSQQRARELAQLETLGEALIQAPPDLSTLPELLEEHVNRMFPQDRVEINLYDPDEHDLPRFHIRTAPHRPPAEEAVWERLRQSAEPYLIDSNLILPGTALRGSTLTVKILADNPGQEGGTKEHFLGGIYLVRSRVVGKVVTSLPAVQALASQIGSAYYRAQVHQDAIAAQKMAQELELAGRIQSKFLPNTIPDVPGWDIAAGLVPARQTSGDFYDFIPLDTGCLGLVVADVADKGTGAALFMALSRTLLRTYAMQYPDNPAEAICATNARILTDAESDQFVTVFYGVLDPVAGRLTYVSAGHNPVFVVNGQDESHSLTRTGIPLGLFDHMPWQQHTIRIAPGDILVAYTDGVSEAHNPDSEEFGEQRLLDVIRSHPDRPAADIHIALMEAVHNFVGSAPQFDDITLMVVKRQP
jgi:serine phosphatase RsbU (regulator of sigma subunit)